MAIKNLALRLACLSLFSLPVHGAEDVPGEAPKQLATQVRALLSDRCFHCHGPDSGNRAADLRLDLASEFIDHADAEYAVVVSGEPDESELLRRIESQDPDEQMPPPEANLSITAKEKALLRTWIQSGAPWTKHWSFVTPKQVKPPTVAFQAFDRNVVDRFIGHRLQQEGLTPADQADPATLLRRVSFDLTGLPPTLKQLDAFLANPSDQAYEQAVDQLLASSAYGERMAVDWLDAARYADTYGYQNDRPRRVWPWRDWVVDALNNNLPYDQFITWQLAGDLLPNSTTEQRLATAFCRLHRETNEGGSLPLEFRTENVADRTNTLGAAFMGLTLECARCHDHKFDPVTQLDYYELFAYFNNTGELGLYSHYTNATPTPAMDLPSEQQAWQLQQLQTQVQEAEAKVASLNKPTARRLPDPVAKYSFDALGPDEKWVLDPEQKPGVAGQAIALDGENGWTGAQHAFDRSQPFSLSVWLRPSIAKQDAVVVHRSRAWLDACGRGYQLTLDQGRPAVALVHFWPGDALQVVGDAELPLDEWSHVTFTYDGSSRASGLRIYVNGTAAQQSVTHDCLQRTIRYQSGDLMPDTGVRLTVGHRFRGTGFKAGAVDELQLYTHELTAWQVAQLARQMTEEQGTSSIDTYYQTAIAELQAIRAKRDALQDRIAQIPVMREQPTPGVTHFLNRGAYDAPGDPVSPRTLSAIGADLPAVEPNRLGLAKWLTHPQHPLTARVAVNRFWQSLFGRGLVATPNDFGSQGAPPSHPELLDYLAVDFIQSGWDVKRMIRLMVTSSTYRQASHTDARLRELDPDNQLLARGPRGRLSAEMLRDAALAASGSLQDSLGGPPVHPFQPPGLWEEKGAAKYQRDVGPGSHRRSLYTVWKRTSPPPSMMTFDAAEREVCVMRRQATATPLQALVLLNDPQYVEAAGMLAYRALRESSDDRSLAIKRMFRLATSRSASQQELAVLHQLYQEQARLYESQPDAARQFLSIGDLPSVNLATASKDAALAAVALAILNHDAVAIKR